MARRYRAGTVRGAASTWTPGYSLPAVGATNTIGTNQSQDIRPGAHSAAQHISSIYNAYGAGDFCPGFSTAGMWAIAGSGGHTSAPTQGCVAFDFTDATWKFYANANGVTERATDYAEGETTGSPEYELSTGVPAPAHLYAQQFYIGTAEGGGTQGSLLRVLGSAITTSSVDSGRSHRFDFATRAWSRYSSNRSAATLWGRTYEDPVVIDRTAARAYAIYYQIHGNNHLAYMDLTGGQAGVWQTTATYPWVTTQGTAWPSAFMYESARLIVMQVKNDLATELRFFALNVNNVAAGWTQLTLSASPPTPWHGNNWVFHSTRGAWYSIRDYVDPNNYVAPTLWKLTPPSTNPLTNAWTLAQVTIAPALTEYVGGSRSYNRLCYVPAIDRLAWIASGNTSVQLINPA